MLIGCQPKSPDQIKSAINKAFSETQGVFAIAFKDLQNGNTIFINENSGDDRSF
jgi:hypothetical protein